MADAQIIVIGSGAGGAVSALELAREPARYFDRVGYDRSIDEEK